ncbi:hypothetical protein LCI18_011550 [Fusarium solani-melongenae]|uniref:Uncharacterized protein n=1 Tax=Fusarium solani subsp. cucurbitae TaxID=2747967 RepID=A0ACD3ZHP2_FUSSC|nr:hypothetical protein LCI18_011550 [Fusarium solani-melongenae]
MPRSTMPSPIHRAAQSPCTPAQKKSRQTPPGLHQPLILPATGSLFQSPPTSMRLFSVCACEPSREASRYSYIWIDQICIDQSNLKERNAQVALMRRIYKQAQKCLVWLGGDDKFSETGLETMARLWNMTPEMTSKFAKARIFEAGTYEKIGMEPIGPWEWIAYYAFLGRSWFWRSWVVQEAALSQELTFCCGISAFSLDIIGHGFRILNNTDWATSSLQLASTLGGYSHGFSKEAEQIKLQAPGTCLYRPNREDRPNPSILEHLSRIRGGTLGFSNPNHRALSQILFMFQELKASDPRDKVYSLLALAEESGQVGTLVPDYRKFVAGVFQDTMQFLLQSSSSLNDLSKKEDPRETKTANLPSWVPDFTSNRTASPRTFSGLSPWSAGEHLGKTHMVFHPGAVLEVRALCIGRVCEVHDPSTPFNLGISVGQRSLLKVVQALSEYSWIWAPPMTPALRSFLNSNGSVPNKDIYHEPLIEEEGTVACQSRLEVLWRTLIVDCFAREFPPSNSMVDLFVESWISSVQTRMATAGYYSDTDLLTLRRKGILRREEVDCSNWDALRSSISDMYQIGLCPESTLEGDEVWIFAGAHTPFVLRPRQGGR